MPPYVLRSEMEAHAAFVDIAHDLNLEIRISYAYEQFEC